MRDLESRERNALEEMLGKAEISFATVWCYSVVLQCGVIPAVGSPSTSLQMLFCKAQDELLQKPSGSKGT